jgi:hypothetical protein
MRKVKVRKELEINNASSPTVKSSSKQPENSLFMLFWGIWAPPNGPEKVNKGLQVDKMYGPMS